MTAHITYLSVLHGSDVRPQPAVCLRNHALHVLVYFIQNHCKASKIIHLKGSKMSELTCSKALEDVWQQPENP